MPHVLTLNAARAAVVALAAGTLIGCGGQAAAPSTSEVAPATITFGQTAKHGGYWPVYIADHQGFFKAEKLNVQVVITNTSSAEVLAVLSGSVDIASGTPDGFLLALSKGQQTRAVFAIRNAPAYSLIATKEVHSIAELKGKLIGVSTVNSSDAYFVGKMLAAGGLKQGDYNLVQVGGTPNRVAALQKGGIAASLIDQPQDFSIMRQGFNRLGLSSDFVKDYAWTWGVVRAEWAKANGDAIVRFVRALKKAMDWFYDPSNRTQAIAILQQETSVNQDDATATYDLWSKAKILVPNLGPSTAGLLALEGMMSSNNQFSGVQPPSPSDFIDTSYLKKAGVKL